MLATNMGVSCHGGEGGGGPGGEQTRAGSGLGPLRQCLRTLCVVRQQSQRHVATTHGARSQTSLPKDWRLGLLIFLHLQITSWSLWDPCL